MTYELIHKQYIRNPVWILWEIYTNEAGCPDLLPKMCVLKLVIGSVLLYTCPSSVECVGWRWVSGQIWGREILFLPQQGSGCHSTSENCARHPAALALFVMLVCINWLISVPLQLIGFLKVNSSQANISKGTWSTHRTWPLWKVMWQVAVSQLKRYLIYLAFLKYYHFFSQSRWTII